MAKKKIDVAILEKRIDLLEMQVRDMKVIEPNTIDERLKNIEEALYPKSVIRKSFLSISNDRH